MELKNFDDFLSEAKDSQKSKANSDMHSKDATHGEKTQVLDTKVKADGNNYEGDKPDNLDPSINEADSQKSKVNNDMHKNDASHGEKTQVVKEGEDKGKVLYGEKDDDCDDGEDDEKELNESLGTTERAIITDNQGKKGGDHVIIKGKEDSSSYILSVHSKGITFMRTGGGGRVILYSLDSSGKNVIYLDDSDVSIIYKNS